jgi:hypothetical protein
MAFACKHIRTKAYLSQPLGAALIGLEAQVPPGKAYRWPEIICVCGDVGREVIRLTHFQGQSQGQGPYLLLTPYTHGVPHVDCEGPCAVTRTNPLLPPGGKAPETCPHQESNRVPREMQRCTLHLGHGGQNPTSVLAIGHHTQPNAEPGDTVAPASRPGAACCP